MADEATTPELSASEKKKEDWMNSKWRPMMGWMYMLICTMDMVVFPILWSLLQATVHGAVNSQWQPLTLQGAGLFHIAMGAVLGIAAHGRTQEKLNGANNGGLGGGTTYVPPAPIASGGFNSGGTTAPTTGFSSGAAAPSAAATGGTGASSGFGSSTSNSFGGNSGFGAATTPGPAVVTGFGGKPAPVQPPQPLL